MATDRKLFVEDWSSFPPGPIYRDNTARGEYMSMVTPENPGGWYHNAAAHGVKSVDQDHSPLTVVRRKGKNVVEMPGRSYQFMIVLTPGPRPWRDYTVTCELTVKDIMPAGVVARYGTNRDFYAAVFESGLFKLVRVFEGLPTVLASVPAGKGGKAVTVSLSVAGDRLTAKAGALRLEAVDGCLTCGGVGVWVNGPAVIGKLAVTAGAAEFRRLEQAAKAQVVAGSAKRRKYPKMELVAELDVRGHALGRQIRFADLDGDGREEILFGVPTYHQGTTWRYNELARLSAMSLDGRVLWERGRWQADSLDITADLPFQVGDRGKGVQVVAAFGPSLEVLDPRTGKTLSKCRTPRPPKMEPHWDEISQYFGDGHFDDLPALWPDSIRLCNFTGRAPYGDLLVKDRYHNAWALDGRTFQVLWHHQCNIGHYPFTADLNGDGKDEVLLGYSRLDSKGKLIGRLFLGDHPDACFSYLDSNGLRHNLHPSGEAGFIDEFNDYRVYELHLGHVQHLSVANFTPERPDLERVIVTYHGNQGIIVLMDSDDRVVRKSERYAAGAVCQPVNWTGDGRELIAFSPRLGDGGLWDDHFDLVVEFPDDERPGKYMEIHDMLGLGVDQVLVWDEQKLHVYAPSERPKRRGKQYRPVRPSPNFSNYQVNYSIPKWL